MSSASLQSVGPAFALEVKCKSSTKLTIRPSPASQRSVCLSAFLCLCLLCWVIQSVHSLALAPYGLHELHLPRRQPRLGCLGSNELLKGAFQHQVNRNYRPKALTSACREGNALLEKRKTRDDPTDKASAREMCAGRSAEGQSAARWIFIVGVENCK